MRESLVWVSPKEQLSMERVITEMVVRFLSKFNHLIDATQDNSNPPEQGTSSFKFEFSVVADKIEVSERFSPSKVEEFDSFFSPKGVKPEDVIEYLRQRVCQLIYLFGAVRPKNYSLSLCEGFNPAGLYIEWKKVD